jgi:serpin B
MKTFSSVPVTFAFLAAVGLAACSSSTTTAETPGPSNNAGAGGTGLGGSAGTGGTSGSTGTGGAIYGGSSGGGGTAGSGGTSGPDAGLLPAMAKSALVRDTNPAVADTDKTTLANGMSAFAFDLFGQVEKLPAVQTKNFACSPTSVSLALGMTYAGAVGNTAAQLKSVLHVTQTPATFFSSLDSLSLALAGRADEALAAAKKNTIPGLAADAGPNPDDFRLHIVSSIWGEKTLTFQQPFLDTLAIDFGAGVYLADFINQPDPERLRINAWVSQETLNKINDLLPAGSIDAMTRAVLVNAIHLKLPWAAPFLVAATQAGPFTLTGGTTANVPLMHEQEMLPYAEDAQAQAVAIPLAGQSVQFVVLVPKSGMSLAQLEAGALGTEVQTLTAGMSNTEVNLTLPRFKFTTDSVSLKAQLVALGLVDAFDQNAANFSGMTTQQKLFISDVVHEAMVGVDEHGVEAAAATAVVMAGSAAPTNVKQVVADHPFFFGIYDKPTAIWLFLGHVVDPTQG